MNGQIIVLGGGGFSMEPGNLSLDRYILAQARDPEPRAAFVPTASGDADAISTGHYRLFYRSHNRQTGDDVMQNLLTKAELEALKQLDTPTIANAIEPFNVRSNTDGFMGWDLRCMFPELGVMVDYAVTATLDTTTHGRIHDKEARFTFFEAIQDSPKPVVLVLKDIGPKPCHGCHFGDGLATTSIRLGAIGLVTDGGVRDVDTVQEMGFHYFAPGMVPAHGNFGFHEAQIPIEVSGVLVNPGDIIHADVNGVVTIPLEIAPDVIQEAGRVQEKEAAYRAWVTSDDFSLEKLRQR